MIKISACHSIIKAAEALLKYEESGIGTGKSLPRAKRQLRKI
jgi:hypothetical protein